MTQSNIAIDWLILLLSTDWFLEHWEILDVKLDAQRKLSIQRGCREIVAQIMAGSDGRNYYNANFSEKRFQQTRQLFQQPHPAISFMTS